MMEKLNEYIEAQKFLETLDWDDIPNSCEPLATICDALQEIQKYKDLEEQGLLLRLPCSIGSTLYQPIDSRINEYKVIGLCFDSLNNKWMYEVAYEVGLEWYKTVCNFNHIGKTVFLTPEEAEQKLKEMESD